MNKHIVTGVVRALSIGFGLAAGALFGQTPSFEVASIKPSEQVTQAMVASGKVHFGMKIDGVRVDIGHFPLMQLIMKAWDVKLYQVQGPPWLISGQQFDIVANLPSGATKEQVPAMLQKLLEERFKLQVHTETQPRAVYALVVGEGGLKIKESSSPAEGSTPPAGVSGSSTMTINQSKGGGGTVSDGNGRKQTMTPSPDGKTLHLEASGVTLAELAEGLSPMTDQPIVDATGLKGKYDISMDLSIAEMQAAQRNIVGGAPAGDAKAGDASEPGGSVFTAIKQLGLKLERRKEPITKVIVDHCEKMPTDN